MDLPPSPSMAFIGAGRVAQALAPALLQRGWAICAVASRSTAAAQALAHSLSQCAATSPGAAAPPLACDPQSAVDRADMVWLTVPDDAIAALAARLRWRAGQAVVHCSGATEVAALQAAADAGAHTGGFHPLQIFSDPQRAAERLAGSSATIEADEPLRTLLQRIAASLGLQPLTLPPGARAAYHASCGYFASFMLPLFAEALQVWGRFGIDEAAALQALLPLARGTLDAVQARGLAGALSGPLSRGDSAVLQRQLAALGQFGEPHRTFFRELAQRQLPLAAASGRLSAEQLARLQRVLTQAPQGPTDPT
ncbi:MAG: DUF2520 domain-containing protein [Burkholderiales bacterium]